MLTKLVICLGNEARGDDGIGREVGRRLIANATDDTRIMTAAGLDVAMAEDVAAAGLLIVVDAELRETPPVSIRALEARASTTPTGHGIDPEGLLALSLSLYGAAPAAHLVTLAAPRMGHHEGFSAIAEKAAAEAVGVVERLVRG